jgi:hypothetical protein
MQSLEYELRKCKECSCSRCNLNGTVGCYIDIAIKELRRYEQAFDAIEKDKTSKHLYTDCTNPDDIKVPHGYLDF